MTAQWNRGGGLRTKLATLRSRWTGARWVQDRLVYIPLGLLVAWILALTVYSTVIHNQTDDLRAQTVAVVTPAILAAQDLIVAIALEAESYREAGATPGTRELRASTAARRLVETRLAAVLPEADEQSARQYTRLHGLLVNWDQLITEPRSAVPQPGLAPSDVPDGAVNDLLRDILLEATELQRVLYGRQDAARAQIDTAELLDWYATLGLVVLSLAASLFVINLMKRVRSLADVAEQRRVRAEAASADRARLIRGITHDVKNPLGAADGNAELLELGVAGDLNAGQREIVSRIRRGIGSALAIVSELVELGRAEGRLELDVGPIDLARFLGEVVEDFRGQAESAGLALRTEIPESLTVYADARRVRDILSNLLSNAVKYTPAGGQIAVSAEVRDGGEAPAPGKWAALSVTDTGPGLAPEDRERVFHEFYRAAPTAGQREGAGLGLTISRRIARLMHGEITVESELGAGSTFTLWLPVAAPPESADQAKR